MDKVERIARFSRGLSSPTKLEKNQILGGLKNGDKNMEKRCGHN